MSVQHLQVIDGSAMPEEVRGIVEGLTPDRRDALDTYLDDLASSEPITWDLDGELTAAELDACLGDDQDIEGITWDEDVFNLDDGEDGA